jgi:hypothetical protein
MEYEPSEPIDADPDPHQRDKQDPDPQHCC